MEIRELAPLRDEDVDRASEFIVSALLADAPWVRPMTTEMRREYWVKGWDGDPPRVFVGERDGELVAWASLELPTRDNTHLSWANILVRQDVRRQGLGTQLFDHLVAEARAAGRTSFGTDGWESDAAWGFAAKHGLAHKSQEIQRRLNPQEIDRELLEKHIEEAQRAASAYELVRIHGRTPDELIDAAVAITGAINDAPTDDLDIEDEVFTVERLRAYEDTNVSTGRLYTIYARHLESGELAGKTIVQVENERPNAGNQHDTSVVAAHRGHKLGLLLKASMVQWLAVAEPQVDAIDTFNAESNDHMIGINEQLGYVILGRALEFQRDL
ncbi:MAG TPA: GNAT family N-acetyltransferase [Nocardioidaceae bacterium]|nr:GNAT family N-acetyltransferase [Nocardioidaceae bacterium]